MSGKDLSREEFIALTMWGDAISVQVRDRGQVALHVMYDAPRSSENGHPVLLEARDVARLRALLNEAEWRGAVSESFAEPMSERELEEIEERVRELPDKGWTFEWDEELGDYGEVLSSAPHIRGLGFVEITDWQGENEAKETQIFEFIAHARTDVPELLAEVRRSHAENAELRDKVRELEGEEVIEHPIVLKASLACAENQRDYYYQMWQQQTAELRERVAELEEALRVYANPSNWDRPGWDMDRLIDEHRHHTASAALPPKQEEEEEERKCDV